MVRNKIELVKIERSADLKYESKLKAVIFVDLVAASSKVLCVFIMSFPEWDVPSANRRL